MRKFHLNRIKDISGVSGTGVVAEGVLFSNGYVAMTWLTETSSVVIYSCMADVEKVHGHAGATEIVWLETDPFD